MWKGCDMKYTELIMVAKSTADGDFIVQKLFIFSNAMYSIISLRKENKYNACISKMSQPSNFYTNDLGVNRGGCYF